jgi:hypothetical protein
VDKYDTLEYYQVKVITVSVRGIICVCLKIPTSFLALLLEKQLA